MQLLEKHVVVTSASILFGLAIAAFSKHIGTNDITALLIGGGVTPIFIISMLMNVEG